MQLESEHDAEHRPLPVQAAGLPGALRRGRACSASSALRAIPGVEQVTADRYTRTVRTADGSAVIELIPQPGQGQVLLRATLSPEGPVSELGARQVEAGSRRLLDADADPAVIDAALTGDDLLAPLVRARPGLRVPGSYDGFELAVRAVLGRQVSVAAASTFAAAAPGTARPPHPAARPG